MIETVSPGWANGFRPTAPRCECDTSGRVFGVELTGSGVVTPTKKEGGNSEKTPAVFEKTRFFWGGGQRVVEFWFGI